MLKHLEDVRDKMVAEVEYDEQRGALYTSVHHSEAGKAAWPELLREGVRSRDIAWLTDKVSDPGFWNKTYRRRKPSGGYSRANVPVTAPATLAAGEFLRFYTRALCREALESGRRLRVVRVRDVDRPRGDSEAKVGMTVDPRRLLDDLRRNIGIDTFLGIPAGPNSGLGVELR